MTWNRIDANRSYRQGWILAYADFGGLEIQRDDSRSVFRDDSEARGYVKDRASMGCALARKALARMNEAIKSAV